MNGPNPIETNTESNTISVPPINIAMNVGIHSALKCFQIDPCPKSVLSTAEDFVIFFTLTLSNDLADVLECDPIVFAMFVYLLSHRTEITKEKRRQPLIFSIKIVNLLR